MKKNRKTGSRLSKGPEDAGAGPGGISRLREVLASPGIDTVAAVFPDHLGRLMGKRIPSGIFSGLAERGGRLHSCDYLLTANIELDPLPGFSLASWKRGYGDFDMAPDLATARPTPWHAGGAAVICDLLHTGGRPVEESPRRVLQRQVERLAGLGLTATCASELEFFLFKGSYDENAAKKFRDLEPTTPFIIDYCIHGTSRDEAFLRIVRNSMEEAGITVEGSKGEWGRGQHEVNLEYSGAVEMADRHVLFKEGVKTIAGANGVSATFMAKPSHEMAGSSCHIHLGLYDKNGENIFWDGRAGAPSERFGSFLEGCMEHARELALFSAPTVNSYKRYRSATFAPVCIAWGHDNRTCGFRTVGSGRSFRIENRMPGADVNPYLAFSAMIAAGIDGMEKKLKLRPPTDTNAYLLDDVPRLPATLAEAIALLRGSAFARAAFGDGVVEHYLMHAGHEMGEFNAKVTDWEVSRYFERI